LDGVGAGVGLGVKALRVPPLLASGDRANDTARHWARNKIKAFMVYMFENVTFEKDVDGAFKCDAMHSVRICEVVQIEC
jgi:hypothetical protein